MSGDPCGFWQEHPERLVVLRVHVDMLWAILDAIPEAQRQSDAIVRREMKRMFKESVWAVTEVKVSAKHDLRYVSEGLVGACQRHGPVRSWMRGGRPGTPKLNHEHVVPHNVLRERLFNAKNRAVVEQVLSSAMGCVVTVDEHALLKSATGEGWGRYASAGIAVWDRCLGSWRTDCGVPTLAPLKPA